MREPPALPLPSLATGLLALVLSPFCLAAEPSIDDLPPMPPLEDFNEIIKRPLFNASRRPESTSLGSASERELKEQWLLTGVVLRNEEHWALFSHATEDRHMTLAQGQPLDEHWQLVEIGPQSVILQAGDERVEMPLTAPQPQQNRRGRQPQDDKGKQPKPRQ
ncbi:hypothetical protein [Gallaecimonas sp. GXIMD4217]|uniref:hypothetical protein n=1 Tax=Gallaecimonas sp. GXIMD4217 TaxID=3131927 RepID=UPI00311AC328